MPEYLAPGVYIEETSLRAKSIEGVPTSTAAFIGAAERGPITPLRVTSLAEFARAFGTASPAGTYLAEAAAGYFANGGNQLVVCRVVAAQASTAQCAFGAWTLTAAGPGAWGNRVWVRVDPEPPGSAAAVSVRVRVAYWPTVPPAGLFDPFDAASAALRAAHPPAVEEDFRDLSAERLAQGAPASALVRISAGAGAAQRAAGSQALAGGSDGALRLAPDDIDGAPTAERREPQGLAALRDAAFDDVALVYAPAADVDSARRVIAHCEAQRYRFAIVDGPANATDAAALAPLDPRVTLAASSYAAFYMPWLRVAGGGAGGASRQVPPGGHVAGLYARTDRERGVHKAPANEVVQGIAGLVVEANDAVQDVLNPRGVNLIRRFDGRGTRLSGARTLSNDPEFKYVNVRRTLIYLEHSIDRGTQWAVFEPNGEALWRNVSATVSDFLYNAWRNGVFQGVKPEEAYFVRCDRTTMTQTDLDNGRLICLVGVALVKPAEFVIFRVGQFTQSTTAG